MAHGDSPTRADSWDLEELASAERLADWMFAQFADLIGGNVVEVGAGIGTFSERLLAHGAKNLLLLEPNPHCMRELERKFSRHEGVRLAAEALPESAVLSAAHGTADLVVCQNVLEHIEDDFGAASAMAAALRPGGHLVVLVPAHPNLYGSLDKQYAHRRRYTRRRLKMVVASSGLQIADLYSFNLLGVPGWWLKSKLAASELGHHSLAAYEALVRVWRPIEQRIRPPWGLSLVVRARRPA